MASQNQQPLQQHQQPYMADFQAGVTACLRSWSALRTAAEGGWGGGTLESHAKAEELRRHILTVLDGKKCPPANYDVIDLADNLAIYMEEEFSVTLEDDSEQQVAETIFEMYEGCFNGNPTLARHLVAVADAAVALNSQYPVKVQTTEHDDDDDDDEDMVDETLSGPSASAEIAISMNSGGQQEMARAQSAVDYSQQPLFGTPMAPKKPAAPAAPIRQLGESASEDPAMEMDDDGFAPVKPKGRKKT